MRKQFTFLMLLLSLCIGGGTLKAQMIVDYMFSTGTDATKWIQLSTTTSLITSGDNSVSTLQNIGFSFPFGESTYTQFSVNADGNLRLGSTVTGYTYYSSPFSSTNASYNNPKINAMGCDGYLTDSGHVYAQNTVNASGESLLVVEFYTSTYTTTSRPSLLKWQVHLYPNGNIEIVYHNSTPPILPAVTRQVGLCMNASDGYTINASHEAAYFTNGTSSTIATSTWPNSARYYSFTRPTIPSCGRPSGLAFSNTTTSGTTLTWTDSTASSWLIEYGPSGFSRGQGTFATANTTTYTLTNLLHSASYDVYVNGLCATGDTSFALAGTFATLCGELSLPFTYDFESDEVGSSSNDYVMPRCWTRINDATNTSNDHYPYVGGTASYAHSGSKYLYFYLLTSASYANNMYAVLPAINTTDHPMTGNELLFWARMSSTSEGEVIVGVMTDPENDSTFVAVDTITIATGGYNLYTVSLANYTGSGKHIALHGVKPSASRTFYIDDITVREISSCPTAEDVAVTALSYDEATISWTGNALYSGYTVYYGAPGFSADTAGQVTGTGNTATLTNLQSDTEYEYYVVASCAGSEAYATYRNTFRTACEPITTLPYSYSFEDATGSGAAHAINSCWTEGTNYSTAYPYPSSTYSHTGDYSYLFYNSSTAGIYSYAAMPLFEEDINRLQANFYMLKTSTNYGHLQVGVMTNPNDITTFTLVADLQVQELNTWEYFEVPFSGYTGDGQYIAFLSQVSGAINNTYLDDLTIDYLPACPRPTGLTFSDTTTTGVTLSWTENGTATSWLIEYGPSGFTRGQGEFVQASSTSYTLNNLTPSTYYDVYLNALCGDTSTTFISRFATLCGELELPFAYDFETSATGSRVMPYCWNRYNPSANTSYNAYPYVNSSTTNAYSGSNYITFNQSTSTSYPDYHIAILPAVNTTDYPMTGNEFVFWSKVNSSTATGRLIIGVMTNPEVDTTFTPVDTVTIATGGYNIYTVNFANYSGNGQYIALYAPRPTSSAVSIYVDDIEVRVASTCPTVENPVVSGITNSEATISWDGNEMQTSFDIFCGLVGFDADTVTSEYATDTAFTFNNLQPDTEYEYYIVAYCNDGSTANATARYTFRTACDPIATDSLPYVENFEAYGSGATNPINSCWTKGTNSSTAYPYPYSTAAINGSRGLYFYSSSSYYSYAALPLFENDVNTLRLRFNLKRYSSTSYTTFLCVGVMSNPDDLSTFEGIDTINLDDEETSSVHAVEIFLDQYTGEGRYIAFYAPRNSPNNYAYVDDVVVDAIPNCRRSEYLVADSLTANGATLSWYNANAENVSSYTIAISTDADFNPDTCTNTYSATDTTITITGLNSHTVYYWSVLADCGGDSSDWAHTATFQTDVDCGEDNINVVHTIGEGTSASYLYAFYTSTSDYPTAYTRHILTATEMNEMGLQTNNRINSIALHTGTTGGTINDVSIYLMETDLEAFSATPANDTIARDSMTLVFSGNLTFEAGEWKEIIFNAPFSYGGTRNLMVLLARDGSYTGDATFYYTTTSPDNRTCYGYRSTSTTSQNTCTRSTNRPNMRFNVCIEVPECSRPTDVAATNILSDSATLAWNGTATQYEVAYGTPGFNPDTTDATLAGTHVTVSSNGYILFGLTPDTEYEVYVRALCGSEASPWSSPLTFRTICAPKTLPYMEDFESYASGSTQAISTCWTKGTNSTTQYPYPASSTSYLINGDRYLYFYSNHPSSISSTAYYSYAALPLFDAPLDTLTLTFKMRRYATVSNTYTSLLYVGVMTDPSDISTFTAVDTIDLQTEPAYSLHGIEVTFENYQGNGRYIALYAPVPPLYGTGSSATNYVYVDDVKVDYTSGCPSPINLTVDTTTATTATISWTDRAISPAGYELEYGIRGFEQGTGTIVASTTNPATITGLLPGNNYEVYVRALCGTDAGSWSMNSATFSTECQPITTLPVTYDFENEVTSASANGYVMPLCWNRINDATGTTNYLPYIDGTSSYAHSGTKYLYFYTTSSTSTAYNMLAVLPEIDTTLYPANTLEVIFWGRGSSTASYDKSIIVGMMSDPTNQSTFVAMDTILMDATMTQYTVPFDSYTGHGSYPAFKLAKGTASYGYAYIDDITIAQMSPCGRPHELTAISSTATTATLGWTDTVGATQWSIEYSELGNTTTTTVVANANPFTLTGLNPATNYTFRVASYCSDGTVGGVSLASCNFATSQVPATLPYTYNFEDGTEWNNWQTLSNRTINWYRGTAAAADGSYSMYISADSGATRSTNLNQVVNACAYRDIDFGTTPNSYTVTFKANVGGDTTGSYDGVSVLLVDPSTYVEPSDGNITSPWGHVNDLSLGMDRRTNGWETNTFYFDNVSGVKRMVFYWFNQSTGEDEFVGDPAAIDSVAVAVQPCQRPYDLYASNLGTNSATLNWGGDANGTYEVTYRVYGADPATNISIPNITGTNYNLTGLLENTQYIFWVRHHCSNTLASDYSVGETFTTVCGIYSAADTFYEDFHTTAGTTYSTAGVLPECWVGYSNGTNDAYIPHVVNSGSYWYTASDSSSITMTSGSATYGDISMVRLPMFAEPVNNLTLSYWMCTESNTNGVLSVGYLTGDDFENDFVSIKDIPASSATQHSGNGPQSTHGLYDTVSFENVPAEALYIAFKWTLNTSFFSVALDNIQVTATDACPAPRNVAVAHDYANATLTWSGVATSYEVSVKAQADATWPADVTVNTNSYTATGLTPATVYQYRLRAICEEGATSSWTEGVFTTDSLPCFAPANLTATPAFGTAQMIWTNGSSETAWNIHVWNTAFDTTYSVTTNPATIGGLTPGITYNAAIQAACGGGVLLSDFSDTIEFTTDVCDPVTNVSVDTNGTNAVVTWNAGDNNTGSFAIEYGISGFAAGQGTTVTATANTVTLTDLEEETTYDVYVRAICDDQYNSTWSDVATFTTGATNIGINTVDGNNLVTIYPNPAEQNTTIRVSGVEGDVTMTIVDMNGRTVSTTTMECAGDCEKMMNVDGLAAGSYFVRLQGNGLNAVKKLVIK